MYYLIASGKIQTGFETGKIRPDSEPEILKQRFNFCRWTKISFCVLLLATGVASSSLTVVAGVIDHYGVTAASPQNATVAFPLTVTAQDQFNNPVTTDSATPVTLGSSTGHASFGSNPITLVNGVFTVSTTDSTAETVNLTATDTNGRTGTLVALVINPAPASGDYRSAASGNWNTTATWQTFNGFTWVAAASTPTTQKVTIQGGHTVAVTRNVRVNQVIVQTGGTITNAQNLTLGGSGTALDIFGTVNADGIQTTATGTTTTTTNWPLASGTTTKVETGGSLVVHGGSLVVDGTLMVAGGTVTTASGDKISGNGTMSIAGGTVTVGAPGQNNDCNVRTVNMTGGLLILGRNFSPNTESLTGGTIQFAATQTGFQIPQFTYASVILSGNGTMNLNLGNGDTVINGNLSITGTTVVSVRAPLTAHSLTLGGTTKGAGTWGGPLSGAGNINATYFTPALSGDYITVTTGGPNVTFGLVTSSANPALPGTNVTFSMTISAVLPGAGTPTGTVNFRIDGNVIGTGTLSGGVATFTTNNLTHGSHTVVAEYAGDLNFTGTTNSLAPNQVINTPPVAGNLTIYRNPVLSVKVPLSTLLTNASDADGDTLNISVSSTSASNATITVSGGWVFYTPPTGFTNADSFTYTVTDGYGGSATGTVMVAIQVNNSQSQNLTISDLGGGSVLIEGSGIPGYTYRLQYSDTSGPFVWQDLASVTANNVGAFQYTDTSGSPTRFYRTVYP
jgi:large repetitive protein